MVASSLEHTTQNHRTQTTAVYQQFRLIHHPQVLNKLPLNINVTLELRASLIHSLNIIITSRTPSVVTLSAPAPPFLTLPNCPQW